MKKDNSQLVKLFIQKCCLENKINQIIDEARLNLISVLLSACLFLASISSGFHSASLKGELKEISKTEFLVRSIIILVWFFLCGFILCRDVFLLYCRLSRYRQKNNQIDHQIIKELTKIT